MCATLLADGWEDAGDAAARLADAARIFVVGIGTSFHAAQIGAFLLRTAGADARAVDSYEFATYPYRLRSDDAVIVMAHTGMKQYSARAVEMAKAAGVPCIGISARDSKMSDEGPALVLRTVARETSAAYTASHLGALTVLAQVATALGERQDAAAVAGLARRARGLTGTDRGRLAARGRGRSGRPSDLRGGLPHLLHRRGAERGDRDRGIP